MTIKASSFLRIFDSRVRHELIRLAWSQRYHERYPTRNMLICSWMGIGNSETGGRRVTLTLTLTFKMYLALSTEIRTKESSPIPHYHGVTLYCWARGGVSFCGSYHLVGVIPSLLSAIGWGDYCYSSLHATLSSAIVMAFAIQSAISSVHG
eukprot:COSAG02_NODE_171_length_31397_cov_27.217554_28_plen_151_part_00